MATSSSSSPNAGRGADLAIFWHTSIRRISALESWKRARETYNALVNERDVLKQEYKALAWELDVLKAQLAEARALNREMRAATLARYEAWEELTGLYRERQLELARKAERDPSLPLHYSISVSPPPAAQPPAPGPRAAKPTGDASSLVVRLLVGPLTRIERAMEWAGLLCGSSPAPRKQTQT
jgi:hypothetical protein